MSSGRRAGLGGPVSTRSREDSREAAGRIGATQNLPGEPHVSAPPPASQLSAPAAAGDDSLADPPARVAAAEIAPVPEPARSGNRGGRTRRGVLPSSLTPSRVSLQRIQIGPRLKPVTKAQFDEYIHSLAGTGVTQSDIVESALVEYMERYPADTLRAALLEGN